MIVILYWYFFSTLGLSADNSAPAGGGTGAGNPPSGGNPSGGGTGGSGTGGGTGTGGSGPGGSGGGATGITGSVLLTVLSACFYCLVNM